MKNSSKKTRVETYTHVEENIYKVNNRYRIRVSGLSQNASSLKKAKKVKKDLKERVEKFKNSGFTYRW